MSKHKAEPKPQPLDGWFRVTCDPDSVHFDVAPPGGSPWQASFPWSSVVRVCLKTEGFDLSDGVYVLTSLRPESFVFPIEAHGAGELWNEIIRRGLFDAEIAIRAASTTDRLFCWPETDGRAG
jgi:hypothetical protein